MALNFGILQPVNIGGQIMAGQQEAQRNQLAQQQLRTGEMQQEKAQMELTDFKAKQEGLDKFLQMSAANGKTGSPDELASSFYDFALTQRDPQLIMTAQTLTQAARERKDYLASRQPPKLSPVAPAPGALGSGTFDVNAPMPAANRLAPAPAAPVNQLGVDTTALENRIIDLQTNYPNVPQAQAEAARLVKQLEEARKPQVVAPGSSIVVGGKPIFTAPKEVTESEFERNLAKSGLPEDQKTALRVARARKEASHAPPISVSYGQEKAEAVDYGKLLVKGYETVQAAANLAQKSLPAIESNLTTLDKGFDTGFGTETIAAGAKVLGALGVQKAEDFATNAQTFLASANAAVLQKQLEQKGPQTEYDAQRITSIGAQLGNTKEANRFVLNVAKAQLQRDIEQRKFYTEWRKTNKTFEGAEDAWYAGAGGKSLFESPALKKYAVPTNVGAAPTKDNRPPLANIFKPN